MASRFQADVELGQVQQSSTATDDDQPAVETEEQQGQDHAHRESTSPYDLELDGPFKAFFGQGLTVNIFVLVCVLLASLYNHKGAGIWSRSFSGISVACIVAYLLLHLVPMVFTQRDAVRCWLAYVSVILRIVAATFLLLLLDHTVLQVVILPLSLVVLVLLVSFIKQAKQGIRPGRYWREHEAELRLTSEVCSEVVAFAFTGMLGTVVSYVKVSSSSSNQLLSGGRGYMAPDCFLLCSLVLGLLAQLFSTVTPYIYSLNTRRRTAKVYLRIAAYASLMLLVLASVMAAVEVLQEWVFIACFITVIIPVLCVCCWLENRMGLLRWCFRKIPTIISEGLNDDKAAQVILTFLSGSFAGLMASNSKYSIKRSGTAVSLSGWFKCSVFAGLYGVLSSAVRMVVFSEMRSSELEFPKLVWKFSAIATIIITSILLVVIVLQHPEEIKNIF